MTSSLPVTVLAFLSVTLALSFRDRLLSNASADCFDHCERRDRLQAIVYYSGTIIFALFIAIFGVGAWVVGWWIFGALLISLLVSAPVAVPALLLLRRWPILTYSACLFFAAAALAILLTLPVTR